MKINRSGIIIMPLRRGMVDFYVCRDHLFSSWRKLCHTLFSLGGLFSNAEKIEGMWATIEVKMKSIREEIRGGLVGGLFSGFFLGILIALVSGFVVSLVGGIVVGLVSGIFCGFVGGVVGALEITFITQCVAYFKKSAAFVAFDFWVSLVLFILIQVIGWYLVKRLKTRRPLCSI